MGCTAIIVIIEVLVMLTGRSTVHIDANNIMLYLVGLFIGYVIYTLIEKLLKKRNEKVATAN